MPSLGGLPLGGGDYNELLQLGFEGLRMKQWRYFFPVYPYKIELKSKHVFYLCKASFAFCNAEDLPLLGLQNRNELNLVRLLWDISEGKQPCKFHLRAIYLALR